MLVAYLMASWLLLRVAEVLSGILELPAWAPKLVLFLLAIGLIPDLILAWAFELTPDSIKRDEEVRETGEAPPPRRSPAAIVGVIGILAAGVGVWMSGADARWVRDVALPQIEEQLAADDWEQANSTALEIQRRMPDSSVLDGFWSEFSIRASIPSHPEGAIVYRRAYDDPEAPWQRLGETPIYDAHIPRGYSLLRIELEGHESITRTMGGMRSPGGNVALGEKEDVTGIEFVVRAVDIRLDPQGNRERSDVRVPGTQLFLDSRRVALTDFRIGRYEVTNREFKAFVDAGGYEPRDLWEHDFVRDGDSLAWDEAIAVFIDTTSRPGPSTWIGGTFPEGQADFPVGGISWYEAQAYARFTGHELPTVHQWRRAHAPAGAAWQVPFSNLDSAGPSRVDEHVRKSN